MAGKSLNYEKILKKIEEKSKDIRKYNVKKIGLFGSYAKNNQQKKSDIDIVVEFKKENFDDYMDLLFLLERMFKRKIDLVVERDLHPELKYIKKEVKYAIL